VGRGRAGGKILRLVKPTWIGFRKNWQQNMLDRLLRQTAIGRMQLKGGRSEDNAINWMTDDIDEDLDKHEQVEKTPSNDILKGVNLLHRYKTAGEIRRLFQARRPLSILRLIDQRFCCVLQNNFIVMLHCMEFKEQIAGACYHLWQIDGDLDDEPSQQQLTNKEDIEHYCILLPKLSIQGLPGRNDEPIFTLIDSEWKEIQRDKTIAIPKIVGANYSSS